MRLLKKNFGHSDILNHLTMNFIVFKYLSDLSFFKITSIDVAIRDTIEDRDELEHFHSGSWTPGALGKRLPPTGTHFV